MKLTTAIEADSRLTESKYYTKVALQQQSKNANFGQTYLVTALTYSHETLFTHAYPHGEQICLKNLYLDRFTTILSFATNTQFPKDPRLFELDKNPSAIYCPMSSI